jgi:chromosome partitioning protein
MRTLAVALQAGGVGKTTLTHNLGAMLADRGKRVLVIDADGQCNLTEVLGLSDTGSPTIYDVLLEGRPAPDAVVPVPPFENLFAIPGSPKMARFDVAIAAEDHREYRLRECLHPLDSAFDYALIDCPPGLGQVLINALIAADEVLVPVQTRQRRVNALPVFLKMLVRAQGYHADLRLAGIVPNQYDRRNSADQHALAYIHRFGQKHSFPVFKEIPTTTKMSEAESRHLPLFQYDRSTGAAGAAADALDQLTDFILGLGAGHTAPPAAAGAALTSHD